MRANSKVYEIRVLSKDRLVRTIKRVIWTEPIGNFCPVFCRYNKKRHLVQSDEGDLSDPFRKTEEYLKTLYIQI